MATTTPPSRAMSIILNHHRRHGSIDDTDLRKLLVKFRETVIKREMRKADPKTGLLRRCMIDALLSAKPTNAAELHGLIPKYLLDKTCKVQLEHYSADAIKIIHLALLTRPRPKPRQ